MYEALSKPNPTQPCLSLAQQLPPLSKPQDCGGRVRCKSTEGGSLCLPSSKDFTHPEPSTGPLSTPWPMVQAHSKQHQGQNCLAIQRTSLIYNHLALCDNFHIGGEEHPLNFMGLGMLSLPAALNTTWAVCCNF